MADAQAGHPPPSTARRGAPNVLPAPPLGQRRWLGVSAGRVALWQAAALGAIAAGGPVEAVGGTATGLAALVIAGSAVRTRGRWLSEWPLIRLRHRRRGRQGDEPALPHPEIRTYADRAGNRVGLSGDGTSWSALLHADPEGDLADLLRRLAVHYDDPMLPLSGLQIVDWRSPVGGTKARWVAIRLDPRQAARAVQARGGEAVGSLRAAGAAALRLVTDLRAEGHQLSVCDGGRMRDEWAAALGIEPRQGDDVAREHWRYWSLGMLHQVCYRPRRMPRDWNRMAAMLMRHGSDPALVSAASVRLERRSGGGTRIQAIIRLGVPAGPDPAAVDAAVRQASAGFGRDLVALHGEHADAVRDSLPLAGLRMRPASAGAAR